MIIILLKKEAFKMEKTKKQKIKKLSDAEYANYIMSLKDERPVKAVRILQKDK